MQLALRVVFSAVLGLAVMPLARLAIADPSPAAPARPAPADDCARARRAGVACVLQIDGEDVGGDVVAPDQLHVRVPTIRPNSSLIRVRRDFLPEIVKTADDL